jgi:hypothetical protein
VAQDHRAVKRITRPMLGVTSFEAAQSTLAGIELRHMIRKGQLASGTEQALTVAVQFVADQSQAWGIRCPSCTAREGLAPSRETRVTKRFAWRSSRAPRCSFDQRVALTPVGNAAGSPDPSECRRRPRAMMPTCLLYQTRIWAMMLKNFRIGSPNRKCNPHLDQGC